MRILPEPRRRRGDADEAEQLDGPLAPARPVQFGMGKQHFFDLQSDRQHRIEGRHRLLEHRGDLPATGRPQLLRAHRVEVLATPQHAATHRRIGMQQSRDRPQSHALSRTGLPDNAQHLAGADRETHPVHRMHRPALRAENHAEILDLQQRPTHRRTSRRSARPSPVRLKPRPAMTITVPGNNAIQGAVVKKFLPSAISTPHSAVGGCAPRPR